MALCALVLIASLPALGDWCVLSPDSFAYLQTARTIRETGQLPAAAMMRPPGFPVVLAGMLSFGEIPFLAIRLFNAACLCATVLLTRALFRRDLSNRTAWVVAALVATSPALLRQQIVLLSEPLFTPLSLGCLILLRRWWESSCITWRSALLAGVLVSSTCLCRSTGMVLIPLSFVVLLRVMRNRPRRAWTQATAFCILAISPIALYQLHQRSHPTAHSYSRMWLHARGAEHTDATGLTLQAERLGRFGPQRLADIKEAILPPVLGWRLFSPPFDRPASWLIGGLCILIAGFRLLRSLSVVDAYFLLTMAMLALWPWDEGVRLVSPLTPLLMAYLAWGIASLWRLPRLGRVRAYSGALLASVVLACLLQAAELTITQSRLRDRGSKERARYADMRTLAAWLDEHASPSSRWTGVAKDGDSTKVLLLGGAYLSRTAVTTVDIHQGESYEIDATGESRTILQSSIVLEKHQECGTIPMSHHSSLLTCGFER